MRAAKSLSRQRAAVGNNAWALTRTRTVAFHRVHMGENDSELSRVNREAAKSPVKVDPELFDFVAECLRYSRVSEGAFDITVGPLMKA